MSLRCAHMHSFRKCCGSANFKALPKVIPLCRHDYMENIIKVCSARQLAIMYSVL